MLPSIIDILIFLHSRDTYSLQSQRKMCGASNQAVELLPAQSGMFSISVVIFLQKRSPYKLYLLAFVLKLALYFPFSKGNIVSFAFSEIT